MEGPVRDKRLGGVHEPGRFAGAATAPPLRWPPGRENRADEPLPG